LASLALRAQKGPARPLRYRIEVAGSSVRWELPASFRPIRGIVPLFHGFVEADPLPSGAWDVRSRIVVLVNWAWEYLLFDRPVRLIVRAGDDRRG